MTKKLDLNIKETVPELKKLLHQQKSGRKKERILVLYLLKTQQAEDAFTTATVIGRNYSTVKRWLRIYRQGGLNGLLELKHGGGRTLSLPPNVLEVLEQRLQQPEGFYSYEDIQVWLEETYGIKLYYSTLHGIIHTRLKASPKVLRPKRAKPN